MYHLLIYFEACNGQTFDHGAKTLIAQWDAPQTHSTDQGSIAGLHLDCKLLFQLPGLANKETELNATLLCPFLKTPGWVS